MLRRADRHCSGSPVLSQSPCRDSVDRGDVVRRRDPIVASQGEHELAAVHHRNWICDRLWRVHRKDSSQSMEYITQKFENTPAGLTQKDEYTKQLAAQGYRITSEQIEQGHAKGSEQCCWALVCLPGIFLAARTPGFILVTYGREAVTAPAQLYCTSCGAEVPATASSCGSCGVELLGKSTPDQRAALQIVEQKELATAKTIEAQKSVQQLDRLLVDSLGVDYRFDWNSLIKKYP